MYCFLCQAVFPGCTELYKNLQVHRRLDMSLTYKKGDLIQQILHKEQAFLGISDVCRKAAVNHTGYCPRL